MSDARWLGKKIKELNQQDRLEILEDLMETPSTAEEESGLALLSDFTEDAVARFQAFGRMQGISSGYESLDRLTKGLVGGELIVIAGKTSMGKTTLALNIANNVALARTTVLFVTLEMSPAEITSRYMAINGGLTDEYTTVSVHTVLQERDELNWKSIDALIANAKRELNVGLVVIDHLHYFTRELEHVAEDLGRITKEFKKNAIRHNVPVILISHVRKTNSLAAATIEDLRGSSYVAQDADIVLMVNRDNYHLNVKIEKNRQRGYDYKNNEIRLIFDKVKLSENIPIAPSPEWV